MAKAGLFKKSNRSLERSLFVLLSIVLLLMLALGMFSVPQEAKVMKYTKLTESIDTNRHSYGNEESRQQVEVLSWEPRAFLYRNFLTKDECEYLINTAKPHMERSYVVDSKTGKSVESRVRTSSGYFLSRGRDKIVRRIEKRIADFAHIPEENGEGIHVLHYSIGQKYEPHFDYFLDPFNTKNGGQRMATMLMYLSDVAKGGETVFPSHEVNSSSVPFWDQLSQCGRSGLSVRPKMGDALLFWSMKPDATEDPMSLHGSCAVIQGNKWSATKWMHVDKYNM